jgi:hypothetical protein
MCKWHWPTWADWLSAYGKQVKNLSYTGYGSQNVYWNLINSIDEMTSDDEVIIMWPSNHRIMQWYDPEWVATNDAKGFFPNQQGDLWFSEAESLLGLYMTHPDYQLSFTHGIIDNINLIYVTQLLLKERNIKHRMSFSQNLWFDARPIYHPVFKTTFQDRSKILPTEEKLAENILNLSPVGKLLDKIDWSVFVDGITNARNTQQYIGIWEYFISKKEYIINKHDTDQHPCPLAHHDFALEKILGHDPIVHGDKRELAAQISADCMSMEIPKMNFIGKASEELLLPKYQKALGIYEH